MLLAPAPEAARNADVILALGTRLNQATTFWDYRVLRRETRIVQVDIDAQEIGRNYPTELGIIGDAREVRSIAFMEREVVEPVLLRAAPARLRHLVRT